MVQKRFYTEDDLSKDSIVELIDQEHHHLKNVMRVSLDEEVELVNGLGTLAQAKVLSIEKKSTELKVIQRHQQKRAQKKSLALALTKLQKLDFTIEKCTELGIDHFYLFDSLNSEKKGLSSQQEKRLKLLCISALKQCGRLYLPEIDYLPSFSDILSLPNTIYVCDFSSESTPIKDVIKNPESLIVIGPEKGFHEKEKKQYLQAKSKVVSLHQNILRAETAAIAAAVYLS